MTSERDALAALEELLFTSNRAGSTPYRTALRLTEAGYRRVDAEHVVVRRRDVDHAALFAEASDPQGTPAEWVTNFRHALSAGEGK